MKEAGKELARVKCKVEQATIKSKEEDEKDEITGVKNDVTKIRTYIAY